MKRYQNYMPFQHETHCLLYKIKIYVKFKKPICRLPNFRMKPAAIFCAVPKTGTMSVHKALEETLGSFSMVGGSSRLPISRLWEELRYTHHATLGTRPSLALATSML